MFSNLDDERLDITPQHEKVEALKKMIDFDQEDESREEVREKKKHKNHKGRDDE